MEGGGHMDAPLPHPWVPSGSQRMSCKRGTGLSSPSWAASPPRLSPKILSSVLLRHGHGLQGPGVPC